MNYPNFLCVGAQKSGTTSLFNILNQHPDIFIPRVKEVHFFDDNDNYKKGIQWYREVLFAEYQGQQAVGEISPSYMYCEYVPKRIFEILSGSIKLIFILRHPVDRAFSHYWMTVNRNIEKESFERAIELEHQRIIKDYFSCLNFSYVTRGFYSAQIKRYLKYFRIENMFFIIFEDNFLLNREQTIEKLQNFLSVKNVQLNLKIKSNPLSQPRYKVLYNFLHDPKRGKNFKKIGKSVIKSNKLRNKICFILEEINSKQFKTKRLDTEIRNFLFNKYFVKDAKELESIIGRKLDIWLP